MVEGARLESVYTGNCIKGSNPLVSADELVNRKSVNGLHFFIPMGEQKVEQFLLCSEQIPEKIHNSIFFSGV